MNKSGHNQMKRALKESRVSSLMDARNPTDLPVIDEPQSTTFEIDPITGLTYIKMLPNRRQEDTDKKQLKTFPGYRLIEPDTSSTIIPTIEPTTTQAPSDGLISSNLNEDVTEFLRIINDVGSRISYYLDAENANDFVTRDIVTDKSNTDSISSNIIKGVCELKTFFYEFGKKIAPPGVNPYCNDDCMQLKKKHPVVLNNQCNPCSPYNPCGKPECGKPECDKKCKIEYEKAPYNPHDLNTYMNCLDTLTRQSTTRDTTDSYNDFNLKVFQSIITKVKTTKFEDEEIDELNVTRPQPFYNPLHMMIEILKIDTKLFNILYFLNLHNSFKSPITGVYYGKQRTKINENGFPVLSDTVTSSDIYNATVQTIDFLMCILKLITFVDIDAYVNIIETYFSIAAVGVVQSAAGETVIVGSSAADNFQDGSSNRENIPSFLYGQLLAFCDAARQAVSIIPLDSFPNSPLYNPAKVANIAYNCTYGLLAVAQMIEYLIKSRCFATIMSMLFPSGVFHSAPLAEEFRDFGPRFEYSRINDRDMQSVTRMVIDGIPLDMSKVVPPNSIPHYFPEDDPICINKATFCTIANTICGISRFLWNSNAPCLRLCDLNDEGPYDPEDPYNIPPEYTTTLDPLSRDLTDFLSSNSNNLFDVQDPFSDLAGPVDELKNNMNNDVDFSNLFKFDKNINNKSTKDGVKNQNQNQNKLSRNLQAQQAQLTQQQVKDFQKKQALIGLYSKNTCPGDLNLSKNRSITSQQQQQLNALLRDAIVPDNVIYPPDSQDLFSIKPMVQFVHDNTFASVITENDKIFTFFQVYVSAFADYERVTYNNRVTASRQISNPAPVNRNLLNMLTNGMKF